MHTPQHSTVATHIHFWVHEHSRAMAILHSVDRQQSSDHGVLLRELTGDEAEVRGAVETNAELRGGRGRRAQTVARGEQSREQQ